VNVTTNVGGDKWGVGGVTVMPPSQASRKSSQA